MGTSSLDTLLSHLKTLPAEDLRELERDVEAMGKEYHWTPNPGPQTLAYFSEADVLLFGGSPGGGKSALGFGLAINEHHRSLIVRKNFTDLEGIIDNSKKMLGSDQGFIGGSRPKYNKPDGGVIHYAGLSADGSIGGHQGVDHDYLYFDEGAQMREAQVRLMIAWLRSDRVGQRKRVVIGSNPPLDSTGDWLIDYFGPWLNTNYPNPALPGELRYFLPGENGKDYECGKNDIGYISGPDGARIKVPAQSRTYIPSSFTDNPFYSPEDYAKSLASIPEEHRTKMVTGNFMMARTDQANQVIPTHWVEQAMERWRPTPPAEVPMCAIGIDVANGAKGNDSTTFAPRYDGWYDKLTVHPGRETQVGRETAGKVLGVRRNGAVCVVDVLGGFGEPVFEALRDNLEVPGGPKLVVAYKGSAPSTKRTESKTLGFANKRAEVYWKFREALDPNQVGGSPISLPNDPVLKSDLTAPTYEMGAHGIQLISKEKLKEELGRSPDRGDAVVMAWSEGQKAITHHETWKDYKNAHGGRTGRPAVVMGHQGQRRR